MSVQLAALRVDGFTTAVGSRLDGAPLAVMLDIDGTLAPIAATPSDAKVPASTRETLRQLVALPGATVALVSGRSAEDAWRLAGLDGAWVIGNHGFELRAPDGTVTVEESVLPYAGPISAAARVLAVEWGATRGAIIESKQWTLSLHYRLVDPSLAAQMIRSAKEIAGSLGLRVTEGKKIIELRPPLDVDKGTATVAFAERLGALRDGASVLYAGDDLTDEDAFRALRARLARAVTARVMARVMARDMAGAGEQQEDAASSAEFALGSPDELRHVLSWLVARRTSRMSG